MSGHSTQYAIALYRAFPSCYFFCLHRVSDIDIVENLYLLKKLVGEFCYDFEKGEIRRGSSRVIWVFHGSHRKQNTLTMKLRHSFTVLERIEAKR